MTAYDRRRVDDPLAVRVNVRFTQRTMDRIEAIAEREYKRIPDVIREAIDAHIRKRRARRKNR